MKRTEEGGWAHLSCWIWNDTVKIADIITMNPICNALEARKKQVHWLKFLTVLI